MKKIFSFLLFAIMSASLMAQDQPPAVGGAYHPGTKACLSPADYVRIEAMLTTNIKQLKQEGKLPENWGQSPKDHAAKPTAGSFIWPLKQQPGFDYNSYYGISNYVDLNPAFPNQVKDWNCGSRTYDLSSGYNHQGVDIFLWPFFQQMQEREQVAIIAVADGVIIGKDNGNADHNCAMGDAPWNAVYIGNTDGTICWYGHMKNNSQTVKITGQSISAGEFLGFVGSSGSSTGPHLHFETHNAGGNILDPFEGPCNPGQSLWANQKAYIEPTVNTVMTHNHTPVFPDCPQLEIIHDTDYFQTGDSIFFAAYYHDQTSDHPSAYTIYRPDNTVFQTWNHTAPVAYYDASYWYWYWTINAAWPSGAWHFAVTYESHTVTRTFYVNDQETGIHAAPEKDRELTVFPNPNTGTFDLSGLDPDLKYADYKITDLSGRMLASGRLDQHTTGIRLATRPVAGIYFLQILSGRGERKSLRFTVK